MRLILHLLILLLPAASLPAAIVHVHLPEPFDARANDPGDIGYVRLPIDFNGDGTSELVVVALGGEVSILHVSMSRVFIFSSPPPNIGGTAASILGGIEINDDIINSRFRWYNGQPALNSFPDEIPNRTTAIGISNSSGSSGHTRGKDGYIGFEFTLADGVHYAWLHFDATDNAQNAEGHIIGVGGFINGWAWETTPGKGIIAGAIPEPSVPLLIVIAMSGCLMRRKRGQISDLVVVSTSNFPTEIH